MKTKKLGTGVSTNLEDDAAPHAYFRVLSSAKCAIIGALQLNDEADPRGPWRHFRNYILAHYNKYGAMWSDESFVWGLQMISYTLDELEVIYRNSNGTECCETAKESICDIFLDSCTHGGGDDIVSTKKLLEASYIIADIGEMEEADVYAIESYLKYIIQAQELVLKASYMKKKLKKAV
jgi:hypothetical protein